MNRLLIPALLLASLLTCSADWRVIGREEMGALPRGAAVRQIELDNSGVTARLTAIIFSSKSYALRVVDSTSPGQTKLASSLAESGCVAGVNGGYFQEDFRPVGLVIVDGKEIHPSENAKLLAGVVSWNGSRLEIVRSSKFTRSADIRQAIQCGPMLVEGAHPTTGLNSERTARRTIVATDGHGQWALIYLTSVTLADAARILTTPGALGDWTPSTALNLDGGSSSGLWAATSPEPVSLAEFGHVRNYIGIVPR
ncbi:MAG: phosphodiester glycosidase family protein [Terrimicrobiaceae bacterium]